MCSMVRLSEGNHIVWAICCWWLSDMTLKWLSCRDVPFQVHLMQLTNNNKKLLKEISSANISEGLNRLVLLHSLLQISTDHRNLWYRRKATFCSFRLNFVGSLVVSQITKEPQIILQIGKIYLIAHIKFQLSIRKMTIKICVAIVHVFLYDLYKSIHSPLR